jgi:hypothetical protein
VTSKTINPTRITRITHSAHLFIGRSPEILVLEIGNGRSTPAPFESTEKKILNDIRAGELSCVVEAEYGGAAHHRR